MIGNVHWGPRQYQKKAREVMCPASSPGQGGEYRSNIGNFGNQELDSGMVMKYAGVRRLQRLTITHVEDNGLPERKSCPDLYMSSVTTGQQHDQDISFPHTFELRERDVCVFFGALPILIGPVKRLFPTVTL
jgi:hypothetical protein